ncbi:MAG TPA: hypothetical protein VGL71_14700 [Urbifossiella sp.]|jgi:hypothetical protein
MPDEPDPLNALPPPDAAPDPLAEALARLIPAPAQVDRDRLMFAAGAESRRATIRLWQAAAGFLTAVGFAAGMAMKPTAVIYVDREPPAKTAPMPAAEEKKSSNPNR